MKFTVMLALLSLHIVVDGSINDDYSSMVNNEYPDLDQLDMELQNDEVYYEDGKGPLEVTNVNIEPQFINFAKGDIAATITIEVFLAKELEAQEVMQALFYDADSTTLLHVYFEDAPEPTKNGIALRANMEVPQWTTKNGMYTLTYICITDVLSGEFKYFDAILPSSFWTSKGFSVSGALVDMEPPRLLQLKFSSPPRVMNQSCLVGEPSPPDIATCINENFTIVLYEELSGLAELQGGNIVTGSHIQIRAVEAPAPQVITLHFDESHKLDSTSPREGINAYGVSIVLPWFASRGKWEVVALNLVDKAGNAIRFSNQDLQVAKYPVLMLLDNVNNATYDGDIFAYKELHEELDDEDDYYDNFDYEEEDEEF